MNLRPILFFLFLVVSISAAAQYNELKEFGLNGPVKSVTTFIYTAWDEQTLLPDTTELFYKTYRHINTDGMVDYYSTSYSFPGAGDGQITFLSSNLSFSFDSTGRKEAGSGITTTYMGDSISEVSHQTYRLDWVTPYNYYERAFNASLGTQENVQHVFLDDDFFIVRVEVTGYLENDSVDYTYTTDYIKNEKGHIAQSSETGTYLENPVIQNYQYKNFDTWHNPTLLIVRSNEGEEETGSVLLVKVYEYYTSGE